MAVPGMNLSGTVRPIQVAAVALGAFAGAYLGPVAFAAFGDESDGRRRELAGAAFGALAALLVVM